MADLVAALKQLRLYGMAACYAEGLEQGQPLMTTATALLTQLVQAEATDRATRSIRYQMHVARFPMHRDLAGFDFDQAKVDRRLVTLCEEATPEKLASVTEIHRTQRIQRERMEDVLNHVFQHQTHHRGQVHAMLAGTSVPPPQPIMRTFFPRRCRANP